MTYVPSYKAVEDVSVRKPGASTQVGCVWCLNENVDAPSTFDIVYYWGGTSMCGRHLKLTLSQQGNNASS